MFILHVRNEDQSNALIFESGVSWGGIENNIEIKIRNISLVRTLTVYWRTVIRSPGCTLSCNSTVIQLKTTYSRRRILVTHPRGTSWSVHLLTEEPPYQSGSSEPYRPRSRLPGPQTWNIKHRSSLQTCPWLIHVWVFFSAQLTEQWERHQCLLQGRVSLEWRKLAADWRSHPQTGHHPATAAAAEPAAPPGEPSLWMKMEHKHWGTASCYDSGGSHCSTINIYIIFTRG